MITIGWDIDLVRSIKSSALDNLNLVRVIASYLRLSIVCQRLIWNKKRVSNEQIVA